MLTNEAMGILALAILWVNTLLITAAAGKELRALLGRRRMMKNLAPGEEGVGLLEGRVVRANGPEGAFGCHRIEQIGRQGSTKGDKRMILFADRSQGGEVFGGAVALDHTAGEVEVECAAEAEVWLPDELIEQAGACPSAEVFDAAYEEARKARGYTRTATAIVGVGARVWVLGKLRRDGAKLEIVPILLAALNPRDFCGRKIALTILFILGMPAIAAGCTALALYRPYFGTVSTVGGALCLAFFLLVQPAGTALRDAVLPPSRSEVRGHWAA